MKVVGVDGIRLGRELILAALFFAPMLGAWLGQPFLLEAAVAAGVIVILVGGVFKKAAWKWSNSTIMALLGMTFVGLIWLSYWSGLSTVSSLFSFYIAVALVGGVGTHAQFPEWLGRRFRAYFFISVAIAGIEVMSNGYLFEVSATVAGEEVLLDEKLYSGSQGFLRAKGLQDGPLSLAKVAVFVAVFFVSAPPTLAAAIFGALLTASRTGIILTAAALVFCLIRADHKIERLKRGYARATIFIVLLSSVPLVIWGLSMTDNPYTQRLLDIANFESSATNSARLFYWNRAIEMFVNYDVISWVLGKNGYFRSVYHNNAESGWLTLLVDNGLLGFMIYFAPLVFLLVKSFRLKRMDHATGLGIVLVANSVFTFYLGGIGNIMYWVYVFFVNARLSGRASCSDDHRDQN